MTDKTPKRPRDLNQWAKHIADIATSDKADADAKRKPPEKKAAKPKPRLLKK